MSDYQFRAWTGEYMVYQGEPDLETLQSFMHHYGDSELMLWSGRVDKHGKKIYRGDRVRAGVDVFTVRSDHDGYLESYAKGVIPFDDIHPSALEVIGNIFEGDVVLTKHELIEEIKELADRYWGMNLTGGKFEDHLSEILDNYIIQRKP
jgi:hypothetical protein